MDDYSNIGRWFLVIILIMILITQGERIMSWMEDDSADDEEIRDAYYNSY